jgi:hypothetical protein
VLTRNHRQEALSLAYIQIVAARCGFACSFPRYDYGIDLSIHAIRRKGKRISDSGDRLDVQAKSTTASQQTATEIVYDMSAEAHRDLCDSSGLCPRILVVLLLPEDEAQWLDFSEEALLLRHGAYWFSLAGQPPTTNTRSVRAAIPRANLFSPQALQRLMDKVRRREPL